jgi:branched-chain amino acid transport system substrate-binding protein
MVPGQHHVRMNMYIAQAHDGVFKVVEDLGVIDPKESMVDREAEARAVSA